MTKNIPIEQITYDLPSEKIAKFPLEFRDQSKLLLFDGESISEDKFCNISNFIEPNSVVVFNNTKVIHARLLFFKSTGAKIEIFCLEPHSPADYERAFASRNSCRWLVLVGGRKKWKDEPLQLSFDYNGESVKLWAKIVENCGKESIVEFWWNNNSLTFGEVLEVLGTIPIPPYLCRKSEKIDSDRYQTVYSKVQGSVAAPTAGLHFTPKVLQTLKDKECNLCEVTLHVGAGTFLPVKSENAAQHTMHIEHFTVTKEILSSLVTAASNVVAVGTTSVRSIESLSVLGYRVMCNASPKIDIAVGQWEAYNIPSNLSGKELLSALLEWMISEDLNVINCSTQIMITPGYNFKVVGKIITNFHQPQSTLLLLVCAAVGPGWRDMYNYALHNEFRFLSYGDSSLLSIKRR